MIYSDIRLKINIRFLVIYLLSLLPFSSFSQEDVFKEVFIEAKGEPHFFLGSIPYKGKTLKNKFIKREYIELKKNFPEYAENIHLITEPTDFYLGSKENSLFFKHGVISQFSYWSGKEHDAVVGTDANFLFITENYLSNYNVEGKKSSYLNEYLYVKDNYINQPNEYSGKISEKYIKNLIFKEIGLIDFENNIPLNLDSIQSISVYKTNNGLKSDFISFFGLNIDNNTSFTLNGRPKKLFSIYTDSSTNLLTSLLVQEKNKNYDFTSYYLENKLHLIGKNGNKEILTIDGDDLLKQKLNTSYINQQLCRLQSSQEEKINNCIVKYAFNDEYPFLKKCRVEKESEIIINTTNLSLTDKITNTKKISQVNFRTYNLKAEGYWHTYSKIVYLNDNKNPFKVTKFDKNGNLKETILIKYVKSN